MIEGVQVKSIEIAFAQHQIYFFFLVCVYIGHKCRMCLAMNLDHIVVLLVSVSESKWWILRR